MEDIPKGVAQTVIETAAKEIIKKGIAKIMKISEVLDNNISESFEIRGREVTILCPDALQRYSVSIIPKSTGLFNTKARFELGKVRRVTIRPLIGLEPVNAITLLEKGFELNLKNLVPGELYILDIEYRIEDPRFVESLVNREVLSETPSEEVTEYWMVAQLKHLDALKSTYGRIDLRDIDFYVNVGIHQDVNTKIPKLFRDQIATLAELSKPKGRGEKWKLFHQLLIMQKQKYGDENLKLLGELVELFSSTKFCKFVDVTKDFHYYDCEKGTSVYDYPFVTWPKFMKVISRTDLGLNKAAADGKLIYQRKNFLNEIERIFGL